MPWKWVRYLLEVSDHVEMVEPVIAISMIAEDPPLVACYWKLWITYHQLSVL